MMDIIVLYLIIAISGGITSAIVTFLPIIKGLKEKLAGKVITHTFIESPISSFIVWSVLAGVALPFMVKSITSEKENKEFINSIVNKKA